MMVMDGNVSDFKLLQELNLPRLKIKWRREENGDKYVCGKCGKTYNLPKEFARNLAKTGMAPEVAIQSVVASMQQAMSAHEVEHEKERCQALRRDGARAVRNEIEAKKNSLDDIGKS